MGRIVFKSRPMSRLSLMILGVFFALFGSGIPSVQKYSLFVGLVMMVISYGIFQNGMLFGSLAKIDSLLSLSTLLIFFSGIFIGLSFIIGDYELLGFVVKKEYSFIVGLIVMCFSSVAMAVGSKNIRRG